MQTQKPRYLSLVSLFLAMFVIAGCSQHGDATCARAGAG